MKSVFPVILIAIFLFSSCHNTGNRTEEAKEYDVLTISRKSHEVQSEYAAQIKGRQDIRIIPRVDGYLKSIHVKEGQKVHKGQLLFVIDQVSYKAAVKNAEAVVLQSEAVTAKARLDYDGKKMLREKNVISDFSLKQSKGDLDVAVANLEAAKAALDAANNNLSFTELTSPSDGVVGKIPYRIGDYVSPATLDGLTVVSDNSSMFVYFSITERLAMEFISEYGSLQEAIDSMPELALILPGEKVYEEKGRVESISGIVDDQTGAVSVRAVFPNSRACLLSGGTAKVVMKEEKADAIVIPQEATFEILDKIYVYKVIDGQAVSVIIETEKTNDGKSYIVTGGLEEGDVIIASGAGLVNERDPIKAR